MSSANLVTIASFGSQQEASIAQGVLDAESILSYLQGVETVNTLWYYGSCLGGIKLQVAKSDAERAIGILESIRSKDEQPTVPSWKCQSCGQEVDEGFEVCWSCGLPHAGSLSSTEAMLSGDFTVYSDSDALVCESRSASDTPPSEFDEWALRLWRSTLYSLVCLPLFFYSAYLAIRICHLLASES